MKIVTNAILGIVGGAVGLVAMAAAQKALQGVASGGPNGRTPPDGKSISVVGDHHAPNEPSTEAVARTLYEKATHRWPDDTFRHRAGNAVHIGFGLVNALLYSELRGHRRGLDLGGGLALALGLFVGANLLAVPLLGLADSPASMPLRKHAKYLGAHLAYGLGTAATTQAVGKLI